jgi:hypothetical protein
MYYVSRHHERIEGFFLQSPVGTQPIDEKYGFKWDDFKYRQNDELPFRYETKDVAEKSIKMRAEQKNPFGEMEGLPYFALKASCVGQFKEGLPQPLYGPKSGELVGTMFCCMLMR